MSTFTLTKDGFEFTNSNNQVKNIIINDSTNKIDFTEFSISITEVENKEHDEAVAIAAKAAAIAANLGDDRKKDQGGDDNNDQGGDTRGRFKPQGSPVRERALTHACLLGISSFSLPLSPIPPARKKRANCPRRTTNTRRKLS